MSSSDRIAAAVAVSGWMLAVTLQQTLVADRSVDVVSAPVAWFATADPARAATAVWASTVLHGTVAHPGDPATLRRGIADASGLDETFVAPVAYGSRMVLRAGDLDGSLALLEEGHARWPRDPWFPWLIGMQLWKEAGRPEQAAPWLRRAAALDPNGEVHRRAADVAARGVP